jgi:hypothetical protein
MHEDPHRVLGVTPGAEPAEIRRAYRALAKTVHPDVEGGDAARFAALQEAYETLLAPDVPTAPVDDGPLRFSFDVSIRLGRRRR